MTYLVASVLVESATDLAARTAAAARGGAEAVELRIDPFEGDPRDIAAFLRHNPYRVWIVTCRGAQEGGHFTGSTSERVARLLAATRGTGAFVDFELADFVRSSNIRQKVLLAATGTDHEARLILSSHRFDDAIEDPETVLQRARAAHDKAITKIAFRCGHIVDSLPALDFLHAQGARVAAMAMGEAGLWTRVLAKKFGAFATYATTETAPPTAPGQLPITDMASLYRWGTIDSQTRVFGVIGDPVAHSLSPRLFNFWCDRAGINAVYLPLRVGADDNGLTRFLEECRARPWLDLAGFSVTVPHKQAALRWVSDGADWLAKGTGAVNTLVFREGGAGGYNTDCYAAVASLASALGGEVTGLNGTLVDVLGAGGAARGIVKGLADHGCRLTIYGRDRERTEALAEQFSSVADRWENRVKRAGEILVNTTPVGMWPEIEASPMPPESLAGCRLVFDLIYRPKATRLLRDASARGCLVLNGLDMFLRQASMQFELWFGCPPDLDGGRRLLEACLSKGSGE